MKEQIQKVLTDPGVWMLFYILMVINTFGHCWVNISNNPEANAGGLLIGSSVSAVFWPLYWSVKFWS